ncbi:DUF4192 domain-containing protein [Plantactinospora sp. KBS50]|uniref:DUF4192 domain-containing protein n=1 Tax=Plantactinospora sp. KBS50 TaxID=2024580 RepID=UPI0012FDBA57|nr:DUF4192 domain-containing protein [Plantactinospora sp. KBS50]
MVRSPADLIAAVPFLLGFHPSESLVVVALRGSRVAFAARVDLPPAPGRSDPVGGPPAAGGAAPADNAGTGDVEGAGPPGGPVDRADPAAGSAGAAGPAPAPDAQGTVREVIKVVRRQKVEAVTVLGYGPAERVTPVIDAVRDAARRHELRVLDLLRVTGDRYWSYLCGNPACCPPDGVPFDAYASPVAAAAIFAGQVALPDRRALERQLAPAGGAERVALRRAATRASKRLNTLLVDAATAVLTDPAPDAPVASRRTRVGDSRAARARAVRTARARALRSAGALALRSAPTRYRTGGRLTDDEVTWLGVLLSRAPVQEQAWRRVDADQVALWTDVLRRVPTRLTGPPATLLAYAAWQAGQGALAVIAVERALAVDPGSPAALLIDEALRAGVPPSMPDTEPAPADPTAADPAPADPTGRR